MKNKLQAISSKVDQLIERNANLSSENESLKLKNQEFQRSNEQKDSVINELKVQIAELKKRKASDGDFDVENYKNKLNGLMKEIDECIAILNN